MQGKERRMYDTVRWRTLRKSFLNSHPLCTLCERMGREEVANTVDHVKPWKEGKTEKERYDLFWDWDNLQSLCDSCHSGVKRVEEHHGYSQACDVNGLPIDFNHPWYRGST